MEENKKEYYKTRTSARELLTLHTIYDVLTQARTRKLNSGYLTEEEIIQLVKHYAGIKLYRIHLIRYLNFFIKMGVVKRLKQTNETFYYKIKEHIYKKYE